MNELKEKIAPFKLSNFRWELNEKNYIIGKTVAQKKFSALIQEKIIKKKWIFLMYETYVKIVTEDIELIFRY